MNDCSLLSLVRLRHSHRELAPISLTLASRPAPSGPSEVPTDGVRTSAPVPSSVPGISTNSAPGFGAPAVTMAVELSGGFPSSGNGPGRAPGGSWRCWRPMPESLTERARALSSFLKPTSMAWPGLLVKHSMRLMTKEMAKGSLLDGRHFCGTLGWPIQTRLLMRLRLWIGVHPPQSPTTAGRANQSSGPPVPCQPSSC